MPSRPYRWTDVYHSYVTLLHHDSVGVSIHMYSLILCKTTEYYHSVVDEHPSSKYPYSVVPLGAMHSYCMDYLITLCVPLLYTMMSLADTLTEHQPLCILPKYNYEYYSTDQNVT